MANETQVNPRQQYINVLVVGIDLNFAKHVQVLLNTLQTKYPEKTFRVFPASQKEKAKEYLAKYELHSVLIEDEVIDSTPEKWYKDLSDAAAGSEKNKEIPIIIVTLKTERDYTKQVIKAGYSDIFLKPLDRQLFIQKLNILNKKMPLVDEDMLYSMETEQEIELAFSYKTKVISEYGIRIETPRLMEIGALVTIHAPFLEETILGQVKEMVKSRDGSYKIFLMFVGVTPAQTQTIRKFVRKEYAEDKAG